MDKNGFTLAKYERGDWYYRKKIEGALLEICISDANGRLHMHIGIYGKGYDAQAEQFLGTLTAPRTSTWDWDYWRKESEEKKEKAYKDTLYDFRDILELNGKEIFEKIVTDYKNRIPNRKHYLLMMEHYDELEKKYSEELCPEKCNIVELWEKIAAWVEKVRKYPLEEIEERLIGYVTVMETEMIKRYGGEQRKLPMDELKLQSYATKVADSCYEYVLDILQVTRPVVEELSKKYKLVLVSNFYGNIQTILKDFGLLDFFDEIIESSVVGVRKPDPAIYRLGVDAMGFVAKNVLVVGDSFSKDVVPAKAVGCRVAWLKGEGWGGEVIDESVPDVIITNLAQLPVLL